MLILTEMVPMYKANAKDYAAIYARVSNPSQDTSIEAQVKIAKETLEKENLLLYDIYEDKETATKFDPIHREGFKRLLYDAINDKFKTVIVFRRDRLARIQTDFVNIRDILRKHKISVIYSNKGEFQPYDSYQSDFVENILSAVDELEPKTIKARSSNGINEKRKRGEYFCGACCPYGYKRNKNNQKKYVSEEASNETKKEYEYEPDPDTAPIIKLIFSKFMNIDNKTYKKTDLLTEINQVSHNRKISNTDLNYIIKNPVYAGLYLLDSNDSVLKYIYTDESEKIQVNKAPFKEWVNVNPILKKDHWYEALKHYCLTTTHKNKIKNDKKEYLFKNLLICKTCHKKLYLNGNRYRCSKGCTNIPYSLLIDTLLERIVHDVLQKNLQNHYKKKLKDIELNILQLDKKLNINKIKQRDILFEIIDEEKFDEKYLNKYISNEKKLLDEIRILKTKAMVLIKVSETFDYITCINKISDIQNYIKRNIEISQLFLSSIIEVITLNGKSKCNIEKPEYKR